MASQAPPAAAAPAKNNGSGPIDDKDVQDWMTRTNEVFKAPGELMKQKSPESSEPWHAGLFACFNPIDTCLMTWCVPCVTFGKTHHRLRKDGSLEGYEPVNTSCLLLLGSMCVGLHWIPMTMQRADVREKYNLQGSCMTDLVLSCCCGCCSLVQQDKEAAHREPLLNQGHKQQYQHNDGMNYPAQ